MILSDLTTKILARLVYEAGSSDWWTSAEIDSYINDLYSQIALETELIKMRTVNIPTVATQAEYDIPKTSEVRTVKQVINIDYDGEPLDPVTVLELNQNISRWRDLADGTPFGWFFDRGNENVTFTLVPPAATADVEMYVDMSYIPADLGQSDAPAEPFTDGIILFDGVMSIALGKAGGGRDLDRSDWYWLQFINKIPSITKPKLNRTHAMKSIDEGGSVKGFNLGEHYPTYTFD